MKRILSMILVLMLAFSTAALLVSCNDKDKNDDTNDDNENKNEKTTYTVTVVDDEGAPVRGVKLTFKTGAGTDVPFSTDSMGKASYKTADTLKVTVTEIPVAYEYGKIGVAQSFSADGTLNITLTSRPPFVINVVDEDGNPIAGVTVQMCDEQNSCRLPVTTESDGRVTYPYEVGSFHAQITGGASGVPEGYTVDDPDKNYYFVDGVATIILTKIAE